ncbi:MULTISPECIES: helix-turn-helix domain-containing protein [Coprobacillaceae]|nr:MULTISPECIES: ATP-binding protein [Coprobacillaceae]MDD6596604.1 ATP-binding protein [Catenibacterium mitsuokai]MDD6710545.1 ATP-binding protein [Sharpea porci]MDY5278580.1 ATP-binding protein [Sharpea porci]
MNYCENDICELKKELTSNVKKEILSFLNTKGGTIYVGVEDDGSVFQY